MRLLDGINTPHAHAEELIEALRLLTAGAELPIIITDERGNPLERVRLFQETLTDGSKTKTIELAFTRG